MHEKILFGIIAVLLFSIVGLGTYQAVKHPAETVALVPEAASVVQEAITDATNSVAQLSSPSAQPAQAASNSVTSVPRDDDDDGDEEESDDDVRPVSIHPAVQPAATPATVPASGTKTYTMAQVATHNSSASCYSAINGSVYDLTSFINQHPGGQSAIKSLCGVDGTSAFNGQHGGQRRPASELASLEIGALAL